MLLRKYRQSLLHEYILRAHTPSTKLRCTILLHGQQTWWFFLQLFEGLEEIIKGCLTFSTNLGAEEINSSSFRIANHRGDTCTCIQTFWKLFPAEHLPPCGMVHCTLLLFYLCHLYDQRREVPWLAHQQQRQQHSLVILEIPESKTQNITAGGILQWIVMGWHNQLKMV